jgi:pyruvate formate lyase activating enzyme
VGTRGDRGVVFDVMRYGVHDGPGIRTTVFLKGCPLRCAWCHNPEGQSPEPELSYRAGRCVGCHACVEVCPGKPAAHDGLAPLRERCQRCGACVEACYAEARQWVGREVTVDEILNEVRRDAPFYGQSGGGLTLSGGEPLSQPAFAEALLRGAREAGLHTAVETCGHAGWDAVERVARWTDLFLYDVKLLDDEAHRRFTGAGNAVILSNLVRLSAAGHAIVARLPLVPGVNDGEANLRATAAFLREHTTVRELHLLPFHRLGQDKAARLGHAPAALPAAAASTAPLPHHLTALLEAEGVRVTLGG